MPETEKQLEDLMNQLKKESQKGPEVLAEEIRELAKKFLTAQTEN